MKFSSASDHSHPNTPHVLHQGSSIIPGRTNGKVEKHLGILKKVRENSWIRAKREQDQRLILHARFMSIHSVVFV